MSKNTEAIIKKKKRETKPASASRCFYTLAGRFRVSVVCLEPFDF